MLTGYIRGQELRISTPEIAADSIKYLEAEFHFAGRDWDGYVKTAYFINGTSKFALVLADDRITADMGLNLTAGEWEVKLSGVKGSSRITTTTEHIFVREFGSTDGTLPDVTATQAEQMLAKIGDLANLTTEDKTNLVAAINEAARPGGSGSGGKDGTGIASITYKGEDEDGGNVYTVLLTDGTSYDITAPKGAAGTDGASVTITSVSESTEDGGDNVITFSDGKSVTVKNGSKGSTGAKGDTGATPKVQIGEVTTLDAGANATASITGTAENPLLNLGIPKGADGSGGSGGAETWETVADIIVESEDVTYYRWDVSNKTEFVVLVSLTPLTDSTASVNGTIGLNVVASPWGGNSFKITNNIGSVPSSAKGLSYVVSGKKADGKWIPGVFMRSLNSGSSWDNLSVGGGMSFPTDANTNVTSFAEINEITSISIGSYTKFFGVGSHIQILAR